MTLAERLAPLNINDQGALARRQAAAASTAELIEALQLPGLGEWARLHIGYELTHRGPSLVEEIANALLQRPLGPGVPELREALVQLFDSEPTTRQRVVRALLDAGNAALDAGGGTLDAGGYVTQLADCIKLGGPLPEVVPLARRLLLVAASETEPYPFAVSTAKQLVDSG
jgi:hypothetical protein